MFKEVVRLTPAERVVDYKLVWRGPIASWIPSTPNPRIIVLGDAAHCHLPTSGQGASQSVEDGAAIAACLDLAKGEVPLALKVFERIRFNRQHVIHMSSISNRDEFHTVEWTQEFVRNNPESLTCRRPDWITEHDARANAYKHFDRIAEEVRSNKEGTLFELSVPAEGHIEVMRPGEDKASVVDTAFDLEAVAPKATAVAA